MIENSKQIKMEIELAERYKMFNNIEEFRPFQLEVMDKLYDEKRVCISTVSGNGKTTIIKYLSLYFLDLDKNNKSIIFINTRILGLDIEKSISEILEKDESNLICNLCRYDLYNQIEETKIKESRIFITTPGKYLKLINKLPVDFTFLCIDEVDTLLETRGDINNLDILNVLKYIKFDYSLIVTATLTNDVYEKILNKYNFISKEYNHDIPEIKMQRISFNKRDRNWYMTICDKIYYIIQEYISYKRVIVFCNYKDDCDKLYNEYSAPLDKKFCIHGNYNTNEIDTIFKNYQQTGKILFTTDMAQRGLDVKDIDIIFHIGLTQEKIFYHRNGRTLRRIGASPLCFIFYENGNENNILVKNLEEKKFNIRV